MVAQEIVDDIKRRYQKLNPLLNERSRRFWAATEAIPLGHGGITAVARATGLSRDTIAKGVSQLQEQTEDFSFDDERIRRTGGGRKNLTETMPDILQALNELVDPATRGDPERPLKWTNKSTRKRSPTGAGGWVSSWDGCPAKATA